MILEAQLKSECMCGADVRNVACDIYKKRTNVLRIFDRSWFRDFMRRHSDVIAKKKCPSVDSDRAELNREQIEKYIQEVNSALETVSDLRLLLNIDETGFGRRPDYGKKRSCIFVLNCTVEPVWRATTDMHHVSWVACISAGATYTKHLLLSTRARLDPEANKTFLPNFAEYYKTKKGYMTTDAMIFWVRNILAPYVATIRNQIRNPEHPLVLIMDGLGTHFDEEVIKEFDKLAPYKIIPLPAHSSHLTQPCDGCLFGLTKTKYNNTAKPEGYPEYTSKLLRIKKKKQYSRFLQKKT